MKQKKLLILGSDYGTLDLVREAHKQNIYVIVTDTMTTSPTKKEADEAWMISTTDIDTLEQKCKEIGVDGITFGASDFNIANGRKLCKRLGLPMYCENDRAWEVACNKSEFKKECRKIGAPIATDYYLSDNPTREELDTIVYPVVVKPVDKSGNRGMSYCYNEEELIKAIQYAHEVSENPTIVIERMLEGPEFAVNYVIANDQPQLLYFSSEHHEPGQLKNLYSVIVTTNYHLKQYLTEVNEHVIALFRNIGCTEGIAWVECMLDKDGHFYLLEMGYRFGGEMTYRAYRDVCGFNSIKWMLEVAMGKKHSETNLPCVGATPHIDCAATYYMFTTHEGIIGKIEGLDYIENMPGIYVDYPKREGNAVRHHVAMGIIRIYAKNGYELIDKIKDINNHLKITDSEGKDLFIYYTDYKGIEDEYTSGIKEFYLE